jgi:hypothetical protein
VTAPTTNPIVAFFKVCRGGVSFLWFNIAITGAATSPAASDAPKNVVATPFAICGTNEIIP